jgi:hypothetical protein
LESGSLSGRAITSGIRPWSQSPPPPRSSVGESRSPFTGLFSLMLPCVRWLASERNSCGGIIDDRQVLAPQRRQQAFCVVNGVTGLHSGWQRVKLAIDGQTFVIFEATSAGRRRRVSTLVDSSTVFSLAFARIRAIRGSGHSLPVFYSSGAGQQRHPRNSLISLSRRQCHDSQVGSTGPPGGDVHELNNAC